MTFTEIVTEIAERANLTSATALARIGRAVNIHYKRVTSAVGVQVGRRLSSPVTQACTLGSTLVTFDGIENIERVIDDTSGSVFVLDQVLEDDLRRVDPGTGDPTAYSIVNMGPGTVTIRLNVTAQDTRELKADGLATASTLAGAQEPQFPESFHDILVESVLADEIRKIGQKELGDRLEAKAERRLSQLRLFIAINGPSIRQGGAQAASGTSAVSGGGGSAPSGGTSWTQTGLVTFDRDPSAPFGVTAGSAVVANLDADLLDGEEGSYYLDLANHTGVIPATALPALTGDVTSSAGSAVTTIASGVVTLAKMADLATDRLIGRDTAGTGVPEAIAVSGGIEFTGSAGIQTSAFTGDVTKSAGGTVLTIPNDTVTYAKMQNVSAASRLLGRGSAAGAGDTEEISIGSGLSLSGTTLSALATTSVRQIVTASATGDFTTTSVTNVDVTNAAITITTGASATVVVLCTVPCHVDSGLAYFDWSIDTVDDGTVQGVISNTTGTTLTIFRVATGLSAASHTFQLRVRSSGGDDVHINMSSVAAGRLMAFEFR